MYRQAAVRINRGRYARAVSIRAPVGGWNARDALSSMKADDAIILDNIIPKASDVSLRSGHAAWVTGITGPVESLMEYAGPMARKLFAAANNAFYDVTASGVVGAAVDSGHTNNRWQHVMMGTVGGNFLIAVNGSDAPRNYNGTTWATTPAITGLTASDLIHVNVYAQRLWFVEKNSLSAWYLPTASIGGAAVEFDLSSLCRMGGYLMAIGTWTLDGGSGQDDHIVFLTSEGECLIYQGVDPSDPNDFRLVGIYQIGKPVGRRCFKQIGSDLVVITQDGFIPLSRSLITGRAENAKAISDKISGAVNSAYRMYGTYFGWEPLFYAKGQYILFNIPVSETDVSHQYVVSTITGAWCRFTGQNSFCWSMLGDNLYFGGDGAVYRADFGYSDNGSDIVGTMKTAFSDFGVRSLLKRFTMIRPIFTAGATVNPSIALNFDYDETPPPLQASSNSGGTSPWDTSPWDTTPWGAESILFKDWRTVIGYGYTASLYMKVATKIQSITFQSTDFHYEVGGPL